MPSPEAGFPAISRPSGLPAKGTRCRFAWVLKRRLPEGAQLIKEPADVARRQCDKVQVASPSGEAEYGLLVIADGQRNRNRSLAVPSWPLQYPGRSSFPGLAGIADLGVTSKQTFLRL